MAFILRLFACHSGHPKSSGGQRAQPKFPVQEGECIGCYGSSMLVLHGHKGPYCADCFRNDIKCRLSEAGTKAGLEKCPFTGCSQPITVHDLETVIGSPPVIVNKFKNFSTKDKAGWVACPMCGETAEVDGELPADPKYKCSRCTKEYCARCAVPWHENRTCSEHKEKENKKHEQEAAELLQVARLRGWRRCPECRVYIEKNNGCNHMQHAKCNTHFCYECGVRLNTDGYSEYHNATNAPGVSTPAVNHFADGSCRNLGNNIRNRDDEYYY